MDEKKLDELVGAKEFKKVASKLKEVKKAPAKPPVQTMTFDRWFISLGRPLHHKAGMEAFAKTKGKRTSDAWYKLFEGYGIKKPD